MEFGLAYRVMSGVPGTGQESSPATNGCFAWRSAKSSYFFRFDDRDHQHDESLAIQLAQLLGMPKGTLHELP
jgi:hypothetical protein